jgi:hypothetical protein
MATEYEQRSRMYGSIPDEKFAAARKILSIPVNGTLMDRLPFPVMSSWESDDECCVDCGAERGQVHVPRCEYERCASCSRQLCSCACDVGPLGPEWQGYFFEEDREAGRKLLGNARHTPNPRRCRLHKVYRAGRREDPVM